MKVYVTQGHERGIGLEVFLKTCLLLTQNELNKIVLIAYKDTVIAHLKFLKVPFDISESLINLSGSILQVEWLKTVAVSQSFTSLKKGMKYCESSGILYTLPTSKDQFPNFPGHTEFFRRHYSKKNIGMFFSSPDLQLLLLSDHLPVANLSKELTQERIFQRLLTAIKTLNAWKWDLDSILVSGLNPHAGEGGLIGKEDERVIKAINQLRSYLPSRIKISGPFPGDTLFLEKKSSRDILVYLFHDQGLGVFKALQGFIGSNISLGLPYPRFSPDHGTSFNLYGKNKADYRGCEFSLKQALKMCH